MFSQSDGRSVWTVNWTATAAVSFYYYGKFFGLRFSEQTDLTYKQIEQGFDNPNRRYMEYHAMKEFLIVQTVSVNSKE